MTGTIRIGVGGWVYEPWRGTFFPDKLPKTRELDHAASRLTAIEINGTYYGSQKPATFAKWRDATPDDFVFSVKASRFTTNRKVLKDGAESIARFLDQGLFELGGKLGPILWQFPTTKRFVADEFAGFLDLLPETLGGLRLRHALEVRHDSFRDPAFVDLARERNAAIVFAEGSEHPSIANVTADFVYARIQGTVEEEPLGYGEQALDRWADAARRWAAGGEPEGLPHVTDAKPTRRLRDVFLFVIAGHKVRNPLAAEALIERVR